VPGFEAPVYIAWSRRNRSALVRVPGLPPGQGAGHPRRAALPGPVLQPVPHLRGDAARRARGIEKGYELPPPIERNLYDLTEEERQEMGVDHLPETLGDAIDAMSKSEVVEKALGDHIFPRYIDLKREEWLGYRVQVTPWELEQYCQ
jgi:glutamine synthetase